MPSESGALDPHGKLAHAGENAQLAQVAVVAIGRCAARDQLMKLLKKFLRFRSRLAFEALRHHGSRCFGNCASGALKRNVAYAAAIATTIFYIEIYSEVVATQRVIAFCLAVGRLQVTEIAWGFAVLQDHFLIKFAQISHYAKTSRTL